MESKSMESIHIAEFNSLRQEIMQNRTFIKDYRNMAYTTSTAILALSFTELAGGEPFISLLPIICILPLSMLCNKCYRSMAKIGAYLYVFFDDFGFKWEKRTGDFAEQYILPKKTRIIQNYISTEASYIAIICISAFATLMKCLMMQCDEREKKIRIVLVVIIVLCSITVMCIQKTILDKERKQMISIWKRVKREENRQMAKRCQNNRQ